MQKLIISTSLKRAAIGVSIIILLIYSVPFIVNWRDSWIASAYINNQSEYFTLASNELLAGNEISLEAFEEICDYEIWQDGNTVAYYIGAYGLVPSSAYSGFIYSADGKPYPIPDMDNYPCTVTDRKIRWQQPGGDNFCELTLISDHFFFFKYGY